MCQLFKVLGRSILKKISRLTKNFRKEDEVFKEFVNEKLPIFWIIGPSKSGKTSLAHFLADCSNYRLINISHLTSMECTSNTKEYSVKKTVAILKTEIKNTFKYCQGYILDDFPTNIKESKKLVRKICKPNVVIYISINLDALLGRVLAQYPTADINEVRVDYVIKTRFAEKLYHKYERHNIAIKIFSQPPIPDTHGKLLECLETEFGYKYRQIASKTVI